MPAARRDVLCGCRSERLLYAAIRRADHNFAGEGDRNGSCAFDRKPATFRLRAPIA